MALRALGVLLALAALVLAQKLPLATFHGTVHGVSKRQVTIETSAGNLVDFDVNGKTRITRDKKPIPVQDLATGDPVTIEAKEQMEQYLVAVTITADPKPKD